MTSASSADPAFDALVESLLVRLRAGETLDADTVALEHPPHADRLRALVPVLALVERVKRPAPQTAAPETGRVGSGPITDAPTHFGRWKLRREIGRGGMGRVFDAEDDQGRRAALKLAHAHLLSVPGTMERFLREAEAGLRVEHPSVVRTLDVGTTTVDGRDTPWIVLEHVEGRSLRQLLDERGSVSERLARAIGQGVAEALAAVHAAGLVHRDVKPENVLITPREEIRLMDLGLALARDAAVRLSVTGDFVGTLLYAAPEQLRGREVGPSADLYSLGLLLYELVAGRHPGTVASVPMHRAGPLPPLHDAVDVSPWFEAVVHALLEESPERRLGDAARVAALLREGEASAWWRERAEGLGAARRIVVDSGVPLLSRETERSHLDDAWALSRLGEGRVVLIEGEAGLGKSRLVHDWLESIERSPVAGLRTALAQHGRDEADEEVLPLSAALRDAVGPGDLTVRLQVLLDEGAGLAGPFARTLEGPLGLLEPALSKASHAAAYRLLLRGLAREGPVLLIAEDLDEASDASRRLFLTLARSMEHERVMLVATSTPGLDSEFMDAFKALPHAEALVLEPLGRDASHDLFLAAVGGAPTTAPWHDAVLGAGGNPLCLLEWARAARTAPAGLPSRPVPDALARILGRRLAGLDAESSHLLAVAACVGDRFDPALVCAAAGAGRLDGLRRLHRLDRELHLIAADGDAYRFRHALLRTVVHDDLPPALRAEIHGALAKAHAEAPASPSRGARAAAIVQHALRSACPTDAIPYAPDAIRFLSAAYRHREVAALCESLIALGSALDRELEALAWTHLGSSRLVFAPNPDVVSALERGLALAKALPDDELVLLAALELGAALGQAGRLQDSLEMQRVGVECALRTGTLTDKSSAAIGLSAALYDLGRFEEAGVAADEAAAFARLAEDAAAQANASYFVGVVRMAKGDTAGGRKDLEVAVRGSRALGDHSLETSAVSALSNADFLEGRLPEALLHLDRLVTIARDQGELRAELVTRVNLATTEATMGRLTEARDRASQALESARHAGFGSAAVHAQTALAWIQVLLGSWSEAFSSYGQALSTASGMGNPVLEAKIVSRYLVLLAWSGRFEEAAALHAIHAPLMDAAGATRDRGSLDEGLAELHTARGDLSGAAGLLEEVLAQVTGRGLHQEAARVSVALGACRLEEGSSASALPHLEAARKAGDRMGLEGVSALARIYLACLDGADRVQGRVALSEHGESIGVHRRLRAVSHLARITGDPALSRAASEDLDLLLSSLPESARDPMLTRVPIYAALRIPPAAR